MFKHAQISCLNMIQTWSNMFQSWNFRYGTILMWSESVLFAYVPFLGLWKYIHYHQKPARMQTFEIGGAILKVFFQRDMWMLGKLWFGVKIRGVKWVLGGKLHDFQITWAKKGDKNLIHSEDSYPRTTPAYGLVTM